MIRQAKLEDIERSIYLFEEFVKESLDEYNFKLDVNHVINIASKYVDTSFVVEKDNKIVGVVAGYIDSSILDGSKVYNEVVWFVSKPYRKYGIRLLKELENKCMNGWGVKHIVMMYIENCNADKMGEFYKRVGYKPLERHFIKTLGG